MKRFGFFLCVLCFIAFPFATFAFEGIIVQKSTHIASDVNPGMEAMQKMLQRMPPEQRKLMEEKLKENMAPRNAEPDVSTQTMYIKGPKMRMDFNQEKGERTFMIMDSQEEVVRNFFPEKKAYMEMSFAELEEMGRGLSEMRKGPEEGKAGELKKTGTKKEINGYACQLYTQQVGKHTNEYWITKDITIKEIMGEFPGRMKDFGKMGGLKSQQEALMKINGYPILTITTNRYGTNRNEVIKIEKKGLSDDLFATPDGYRRQSMKEMMAPER